MTLVVTNSNYTSGFINYLISIIKRDIRLNMSSLKLKKFKNCVSNDLQLKEIFKDIEIKKVILIALKNIHYRKILSGWEIYIDNAVVYPNTNYRIVTLCKIINYGTLSVKGSNLFTDIFKRVTTNLTKYFEMYYREVD